MVEEKKPFLQVARSYREQYLRWTHSCIPACCYGAGGTCRASPEVV